MGVRTHSASLAGVKAPQRRETAKDDSTFDTGGKNAHRPEIDRLLVLLSWEAGVLDIDAACRVLGVSREALLDMEHDAVARGLVLAGEVRE